MNIVILKDMEEDAKYYEKTGKPRCPVCKKDYVKESKHVWKPDCEHLKNTRMCIG
jgi:hypothetical protein